MFDSLARDDWTLIMQCEMLAALAALYSLPLSMTRKRKIVFFIDNTGALSALLHGYASKADAARIANVFHLLVTSLECDIYFEWVPSEANISDLPSRLAYAQLFDALSPLLSPGGDAVPFDLELPGDAFAVSSDLALLFALFRSRARA